MTVYLVYPWNLNLNNIVEDAVGFLTQSIKLQGVPRNVIFKKSLFLVKKSFASLSFSLKSILI